MLQTRFNHGFHGLRGFIATKAQKARREIRRRFHWLRGFCFGQLWRFRPYLSSKQASAKGPALSAEFPIKWDPISEAGENGVLLAADTLGTSCTDYYGLARIPWA